jgi:hypothetical protein
MLQKLSESLRSSESNSLARAFSRLGWIGFWAQIVLGSIPVFLVIYGFIFTRNAGSGTREGLQLVQYLTIASLLVLAFTTLWSFRYTRLAKRIADPERRPSDLVMRRTAWTGVVASTLGILFSMLVMLVEVAHLLFYFLQSPKAGVPVIQTMGGGPTSWVSTIDIMSIMGLTFNLFGELVVLIFSLWLLFRTMVASAEFVHAARD